MVHTFLPTLMVPRPRLPRRRHCPNGATVWFHPAYPRNPLPPPEIHNNYQPWNPSKTSTHAVLSPNLSAELLTAGQPERGKDSSSAAIVIDSLLRWVDEARIAVAWGRRFRSVCSNQHSGLPPPPCQTMSLGSPRSIYTRFPPRCSQADSLLYT